MYDPRAAIAYAHRWAYDRNPLYADFERMGGDCTNFLSQCLLAGCGEMNFTPTYGWYYRSLSDRTAAWSGVEFLHRFLLQNSGPGPKGREAPISQAREGDLINLSFDGARFVHPLLIVKIAGVPAPATILAAAHTSNADNRPISTYPYAKLRLVKIY